MALLGSDEGLEVCRSAGEREDDRAGGLQSACDTEDVVVVGSVVQLVFNRAGDDHQKEHSNCFMVGYDILGHDFIGQGDGEAHQSQLSRTD